MSGIWLCPKCGTDCLVEASGDFARLNEEMLLGRARELLVRPAPDHGNLWETSLRIGELKHYVAELAAALERRRAAELPS